MQVLQAGSLPTFFQHRHSIVFTSTVLKLHPRLFHLFGDPAYVRFWDKKAMFLNTWRVFCGFCGSVGILNSSNSKDDDYTSPASNMIIIEKPFPQNDAGLCTHFFKMCISRFHALQHSYARGMVMAYFMAQLMPWATDQVGKLCCWKRIIVIAPGFSPGQENNTEIHGMSWHVCVCRFSCT